MKHLVTLGAASLAAMGADVPTAIASQHDRATEGDAARNEVCVIDLDRRAFLGCFDDDIETRAARAASGTADAPWAEASGGALVATHYEHHNGLGRSVAFVGSCSGVAYATDGWWSQNLSSTRSGVCTVKHYTGIGCDGASETTSPHTFANLGPALNDQVRCLRFS